MYRPKRRPRMKYDPAPAYAAIGCVPLAYKASVVTWIAWSQPGVASRKERMMKLPLAVAFILALVTIGTVMFCLSGAVTRRDTEYGSVSAVFHQYLGVPANHHRGTPSITGVSR